MNTYWCENCTTSVTARNKTEATELHDADQETCQNANLSVIR